MDHEDELLDKAWDFFSKYIEWEDSQSFIKHKPRFKKLTINLTKKKSKKSIEHRLYELDIHRRKFNQIEIKKKFADEKNTLVESKKKKRRGLTQQTKDKVWNRDGGKCVECGSKEKLEFDHIIPHSKGGSDTYRNIQLLCEKCNRSKSAKIG